MMRFRYWFICFVCFGFVQFLLVVAFGRRFFYTLKLEQERRIDWMYHENISLTTNATAVFCRMVVRLFNALNTEREQWNETIWIHKCWCIWMVRAIATYVKIEGFHTIGQLVTIMTSSLPKWNAVYGLASSVLVVVVSHWFACNFRKC